MNDLVTCNNCNWVSFAVSREAAENAVKQFSDYFDSLTKEEQQQSYGGKTLGIGGYKCIFCGGSSFRPFTEGDCPDGCTTNAVIVE